MPITHIRIENYKSIKRCDIDLNNLTALIGANGTGKSTILDAINYFYSNLTEKRICENIFDINNRFSNQAKITLTFDLSNFMKISKAKANNYENIFDEQNEKSKYIDYFKSIISLISSKKEKTFSLQLSQIKGQGIQWSEPYERRVIIKNLFPFFYIDTRTLDINEWSKVWDVLGELAKVSNLERKDIENQIHNIVDTSSETTNKIKAVSSIFDSSELSVVPLATKDFATALAKIYFTGQTITQKGKKLNYYSTGTNSVKYIELLLRAINEIARNKMKEPVVLIDEPEISLHPNFVDELSEAIMITDDKLSVIISTHSARLIKKVLPYENMALYNVKLYNCYTYVNLMKKFEQYSPPSKYRVLDDHINSYFSKRILFVEGETELELFSNPYLQILFPQLKKIDVFQAMSQEPILNIMNPQKNKSKIPYICLIDADKTIQFNSTKQKFELKNEYFQNDKEKFLFRNKKDNSEYLHHLHMRIINMADKLKVRYYKPYYSCNDSNYDELMIAIHDYLLRYKVFTLKTTIEGALINKNNLDYALKYLEKKSRKHDYDSFIAFLDTHKKTDQLNIMRLVFNGKSDLQKNYKGIQKELTTQQQLIIEKVMIGKKTSGWVSEYIDSFFFYILSEGNEITHKEMKKLLDKNLEDRKKTIDKFTYNFPELVDLFQKCMYN